MMLYVMLCVLSILLATIFMYGTRRQYQQKDLSRSVRVLAFLVLTAIGLSFLAYVHRASDDGKIECGPAHRSRICDRSKDPFGFGLRGFWFFAAGVFSVSGGIFLLIRPNPEDEA